MIFSNHYSSMNPNFTEDTKSLAYELSTAVHHSSATVEFKSLNEEQTVLNCSFDQGGQSGHAKNIWDASVDYLGQSLSCETALLIDMNDQSLYDFTHDIQAHNKKKFDSLVLENAILSIQQKHQFVRILKNNPQLLALFSQLSDLFNLTVFQQIAYLIFKIYEKRLELLSDQLKSDPFKNYLLPRFQCLTDLESHPSADPKLLYKEKQTEGQVRKKAQICSLSLAAQMFYDAKLKILTLRQSKRECLSEEIVRFSFQKFFKTITDSVYLSLEGFFCLSAEQEFISFNLEMDSDSDDDRLSVCSLDELVPHSNVFSRNFAQYEENNCEEDEFKEEGKKRRKMQ